MRRYPIGDGIDGHLGLIHVHEHDFSAVRRPEIIAPHGQFFRVHPINIPVEQVVAGVLGQLLFVLAADRTNIQIVLPHVRHVPAIGRKLWISARIGRGGKLHGGLTPQVVEPKLPLRIEDQMFRIGRPQICRHVISRPTLLLPFILDLIHVRIQRRQLRRTDQHFLLPSGRIHVPQLALFSLFIALHKREFGPVRTPLRGLRRAPRQASRLIHGFNGQRLGRSSLRFRPTVSNGGEDQREHGNASDEGNVSFQEATSQARNNFEFLPPEPSVYRTEKCTPPILLTHEPLKIPFLPATALLAT